MQHLDEGTIHAWLDGELPEVERAAAEAHAAKCAECAAAVAEARGYIAAASRILTALDAVPGGVMPAAQAPAPARRYMVPRAWMAVAAVLVLGIGTVIATRSPRDVVALRVAESRQDSKPTVAVPNVAPTTNSAPAAASPVEKSRPAKLSAPKAREEPAGVAGAIQPAPLVAEAPAARSAPATIADTTRTRSVALNEISVSGTDSTVTTIYTVHGVRVALIERASRADLQRAETSFSDAMMAKARVAAPAENSITWSDSTGRTRTLRGAISRAELERLKARLFGATP